MNESSAKLTVARVSINGLEETPYGIRWICKQIRSLSKRKYPDAQDHTICTLIGGFFFLRFINPAIVTPRSYMLIEQNPGDNGMAGAPKPASFAEICEMIAEGKPIPGIKDIPDTILEGQASDAQKEKRRKPWERSAGSAEKPSWMT